MSEQARQQSGGQSSSSSVVLVVVLWALVLIPLLWGIYQTLLGVVALFTGG
ncbi:MAG TPA: hypothetical protein VEP28_06600 [Rubrobacter sp.]|nr:hypothetical protein [Rubrobacter sp.]